MHLLRAGSEGEKKGELRLEPRGMSTVTGWLKQGRPGQAGDLPWWVENWEKFVSRDIFQGGSNYVFQMHPGGVSITRTKICPLFGSSLVATWSSCREGENHARSGWGIKLFSPERRRITAVGLLSSNIWRDIMKTKDEFPYVLPSQGKRMDNVRSLWVILFLKFFFF